MSKRPEYNKPAVPCKNGQPKKLRPHIDTSRRKGERSGGRGLTNVSSHDTALKNFCNAADKDILMGVLAQEPFDSKYHHVLVSLGDPRQTRKSIVTIIREHGVTMASLLTKYREYQVAETHMRFQNRMPEIAEGIVEDAVPTMDVCPVCEGVGKVFDPLNRTNKAGEVKTVRCQKCLGDKRVRVAGQTDARKIVLQSEGVLKTSGGVQVNTGVQVAVGGAPDLMAAIELKERALAESKMQVVEGEVLDGT